MLQLSLSFLCQLGQPVGCDVLLKSTFLFSEASITQLMLPCFCLCFCLWGRAPRGFRNACQQKLIFSVCCQALLQETGPHFLLRLLSQHPRPQVPPSTNGGSGKSGRTKGVADMGFPQLSIGSYMGTWVSLAMRAAALAGREQPSTHSRHMPVTSPRLVLHGPVSANTHASICPAPTNTCA